MRLTQIMVWIALLAVPCFRVHADEAVVAKMKFHRTSEGKKAFGFHWFDGASFGVINGVLVWAEYDDSVKEGFRLESAKHVAIVSPVLPDGCQLKALKGTLNWMENGTSPFSITVSGASCQQLIEAAKATPFEILLSDVQHHTNGVITPSLRLKVVELP